MTIKKNLLSIIKDRSFLAVIIAAIVWFVASHVILVFTEDVITDQKYCTKQYPQGEKRDICTKAVLANVYLTLLIPIGLGLGTYFALRPKATKSLNDKNHN